MRALLWIALLGLGLPVRADWQVEPDFSRISFVSVKRGEIADVQRFTNVTGSLDAGGNFRVVMPFESLQSALALQEERMRQMLFQADRFPQATLSGQVDLARWNALPVGQSRIDTVDFQLDLNGHQQRLKADVLVSRLADTRVQVATLEPVIVKADLFALREGLQRLQEAANLPSIAGEVPVSAVLDFQQRP